MLVCPFSFRNGFLFFLYMNPEVLAHYGAVAMPCRIQAAPKARSARMRRWQIEKNPFHLSRNERCQISETLDPLL